MTLGAPLLALVLASGVSSRPVEAPTRLVVAAGDIATCPGGQQAATAALVDALVPATTRLSTAVVAVLGDNAYEQGTKDDYLGCYDPSWGRHKARTRPAVGNHEYLTPGAEGYFDYFGAAAGDRDRGYYSYGLGAWHVVVLNSNCGAIGGCQAGSAQETWLRADLAAHPTACTLAYWHHPRFSSGAVHGSNPSLADLWKALVDAGAEVALAGHEHFYERFAPLDAAGNPAPLGLRSFIVGTGGRTLYPFATPLPGSEARDNATFGVLRLTLRPTSYDWQFVPAPPGSFTDSGSAACH